jgi:uroporphyrinogen decarboxylase
MDPGYVRGIRDQLLHYRENTDYAIVLRTPSVFVHATQFVRGFEDWFIDLAADQKLATALFEAVTEQTTAVTEEILKVGGDLADVVSTGDDMGFQNNSIVFTASCSSPATRSSWIRSRSIPTLVFTSTVVVP